MWPEIARRKMAVLRKQDAPTIQDPFRLMELPAEVRNLIYKFAFSANEAQTVVCCWPSFGPLSFTSNICHAELVTAESARPVDSALLTVSKTVYDEASILFYNSAVFRFSSSQSGTLSMVPRILNNLRAIEIEDTCQGLRRWDLMQTLERFSALQHMQSIVIGSKATGGSLSSLRGALPRSKFRLFAEHTTTIHQPSGQTGSNVRMWSRISLRKDHTYELWKNIQPVISDQDWCDFQASNLVSHAALDLGSLPKVMILDFPKRALLERRVDRVRQYALL